MTTIEYPNNITIPHDWAERQPEYQSDISDRFPTGDDEENGDVAHLLGEWQRVGASVEMVIRVIYNEEHAADTPYLLEVETENGIEYTYQAKTDNEARQHVEALCFSINHFEDNRPIEIDRMEQAFKAAEEEEEIEVIDP